jgi:hypothetical protein
VPFIALPLDSSGVPTLIAATAFWLTVIASGVGPPAGPNQPKRRPGRPIFPSPPSSCPATTQYDPAASRSALNEPSASTATRLTVSPVVVLITCTNVLYAGFVMLFTAR